MNDGAAHPAGAENVAVVEAALEAFQRQDMEAFLPFLDPEIETYSSPELANPTQMVGRDEWLAWVADWYDAWETFEIEAEAMEPVGARHVIVTALQRGTGKESGIEVELCVYYMFELRDRVAVRYHLYPDRGQALEAAREGEQRAAGEFLRD